MCVTSVANDMGNHAATNDCLEETNESRVFYEATGKLQASLFGHIMRREELKNNVTTGKINGRSRSTERNYTDRHTRWH